MAMFLTIRPRRFLIRVLGNQGSGKVVARLLVAKEVEDKRQKVSSLQCDSPRLQDLSEHITTKR